MDRHRREHRLPELLRPRDLQQLGISRGNIRTLLRRGRVERVARGLYRVRQAEASEHETIALVCKRLPNAVVCLLTALHVHNIGTVAPREIWVAVDRKARKPHIEDLPVRIVRFSARLMRYAVETREIQGVVVQLTNPARTVVDCFRYRNKIGLDVALEALRDVVFGRQVSVDEILRVAEVCRARSVIEPYLSGLV